MTSMIRISPLLGFVTSLSQVQGAANQIEVLQNCKRDFPSANPRFMQILKETERSTSEAKQPLDPKSLQYFHAQLMSADPREAADASKVLSAPGGLSGDSLRALADRGDFILYSGIIAFDWVDLVGGDLLLKSSNPSNPIVQGLLVFHRFADESFSFADGSRWPRFSSEMATVFRKVHQGISYQAQMTGNPTEALSQMMFSNQDRPTIGTIIRFLRHAWGKKQETLADVLEMSASSICRLELGNVTTRHFPIVSSSLDKLFELPKGTLAKVFARCSGQKTKEADRSRTGPRPGSVSP